MTKKRSRRLGNVGVQTYKGTHDTYYLTVLFDKRNRMIMSSVDCAFNARYFNLQDTVKIAHAL